MRTTKTLGQFCPPLYITWGSCSVSSWLPIHFMNWIWDQSITPCDLTCETPSFDLLTLLGTFHSPTLGQIIWLIILDITWPLVSSSTKLPPSLIWQKELKPCNLFIPLWITLSFSQPINGLRAISGAWLNYGNWLSCACQVMQLWCHKGQLIHY